MKILNLMSVTVGLLVLSFVGFVIYFAGGLSSTYPPLKEYYFETEILEFERRLMDLDTAESINLQMKDTTGNYPNDYSVYFEIIMNEDIEFHLKYQLDKPPFNRERIEMDLIGAFDKANNSGGHRMSDSDDIKNLIAKFENEILEKMKN